MVRFAQKFSLLFVVVFLLQTVTPIPLRWVEAHHGNIPRYAVVGGENYSGEVIYVARIQLRSGTSPGKMAPSYGEAHTSYEGEEISSNVYEILTNPRWISHLEWKKSNGSVAPENAVVGGSDAGRKLYVARIMYTDGHMIPGKASYTNERAYVGYNGKEFGSAEWYVLVEHPMWYVRGLSKRSFPELPGVKSLKRASHPGGVKRRDE